MVEAIHPRDGRGLYAESPYQRKLKRIVEDLSMARSIAGSDESRDRLASVIAEINLLILEG